MDYGEEKMRRYQEFVDALEEERRKIQVFHRELPLTMQIVTQAIENCRQQIVAESLFLSGSDNEGISSEGGPVLEEFIPVRPSLSIEEDETKERTEEVTKKPDWLSSAQLWNQDADSDSSMPSEEDHQLKSPSVPVVATKKSGAFHPFHRDTPSVPKATASSTSGTDASKAEEKPESSSQRKPRRCWSQELHRRFLEALQHLGGSHVATPKQIRELMKVDGLTNDEVKSHLQKYRLHTRRPSHSIQSSANGGPQFVVVGGIWVPPPEYAAAAAAAVTQSMETAGTPANEIYAPVATFPPGVQSQQKHDRLSPTGPLRSQGWASPGDHDNPNRSSPTPTSSS